MRQVNHEYYMREALKEAQKAFEADEVPVGAIIVVQERIIARSHNLTELLKDPTAHAEMQAITSATSFIGGKYLQECTLYVTLEPCLMCAGAAYWAHLGQLVYGASDPKRGYSQIATPHPLHPKTSVTSGVLATEAASLLRLFFEKKRC